MGKIHDRRKKKSKPRKGPNRCYSAPAVPANVAFVARRRQVRGGHKEWFGVTTYDAVTTDASGRSDTMSRYQIEVQACDASGEPIEAPGGALASTKDAADWTVQAGSAGTINKVERRLEAVNARIGTNLTGLIDGIEYRVDFLTRLNAGGGVPNVRCSIYDTTAASEVTGRTGTPETVNHPKVQATLKFTVTTGHSYEARVEWVSNDPAGDDRPVVNQVQWEVKGSDISWYETVQGDQLISRIHPLAKPKIWYFRSRVRAQSRTHGHRCWGAWSAWTTPINVQGERAGPPAPDGLSLTFDTNESMKAQKWQGVCTWNETPWWVPPSGDAVEGAAEYRLKIQVSEDGSNPVHTRRETVNAKDADGDQTATFSFGRVRKRRYYRFAVGARSEEGWWGAWSTYSAWVRATQTVGAPVNVVQTRPTPRIIKATWDPPAGADKDDIDRYRVRVYQGAGAANLRETVWTRAEHYRYHVPDADRGTPHRIKVTAYDFDDNPSTEVDEGTDLSELGTLDGSIITPGTLDVYGGLTMSLLFSTTTTDADPGNGFLRLNNATQSGATQAFVDLLDENGVDWTSTLDTFDDSTGTVKGTIRIWKRSDPTQWVSAYLTSVTTATGYRKLVLSGTTGSGATPFANNDPLSMAFVRAGDTGSQGPTGPAGGVTMSLQYDTTTTDADPGGPGKVRFNTAQPGSSSTIAYVDNADTAATDWLTTIDSFDDAVGTVKGTLRFFKRDDPTKYVQGNLTSVTTATGYRKLNFTLTSSSGAAPWANNDLLYMTFVRTGDTGGPGGTTMPLTFSTTTTDADPGNGFVRLNNATQTSSTLIYVDLLDRNGTDWTTVLDSWDDVTSSTRGHLKLTNSSDPTKWLTFNITGATTTVAGYRKLAVSNTGGSASSPLLNNDNVDLSFVAAGAQGPTGPAGPASDGSRPSSSPTPVALGTIGAIVVRWSPITNADPVTYEVHVGTTSGFTVSSTTKVAQLAGTYVFVKTADSTGNPLQTLDDNGSPVSYYVKVVAKDADGEHGGTGTFASPNYSIGGYTASGAVSIVQVTSEDIAANTIHAGHLIAGTIDTSKLSAELGGFSKLVAGAQTEEEIAPKIVLASEGLRIDEVVGGVNQPVLNFPTNSDDPGFIKGTIEASGLVVLDDFSLRGSDNAIEAGAKLVMRRRTAEAPKTAPALQSVWDQVAYAPDTHGFAAADPLVAWKGMNFDQSTAASNLFYTVAVNTKSVWRILAVESNETGGFTVSASNQLQSSQFGIGYVYYFRYHGAARVGTSVYLLRGKHRSTPGGTSETPDAYEIQQLNATTFAVTNTWDITSDGINTGRAPGFGSDGTDLYVVDFNSANPRWRRYNTSGVLQATTTSSGFTGSIVDITGVYVGNADFGAARVVLSSNWYAGAYSFLTTGAMQTNENFASASASYGHAYANGRFYMLRHPGTPGTTTSKYVTKHTTWTWTTESSSYNVAYTFRDTTNGYETQTASPTQTLFHKKRSKLRVTAGAKPSSATGWRIYRKRSTDSTAQYTAVDTSVQTVDYDSYSTGAASIPVTSTPFPTGTDASFRTDDGSPLMTARGYPRVSLTSTTPSQLNNATQEYIGFGTEVTDPEGWHSDSATSTVTPTYTSNEQVAALPYAGQYMIIARVDFAGVSGGPVAIGIEMNPNGAGWSAVETFRGGAASTGATRITFPAILNATHSSGTTLVRMWAEQNSGSNVTPNNARITIMYLGPT